MSETQVDPLTDEEMTQFRWVLSDRDIYDSDHLLVRLLAMLDTALADRARLEARVEELEREVSKLHDWIENDPTWHQRVAEIHDQLGAQSITLGITEEKLAKTTAALKEWAVSQALDRWCVCNICHAQAKPCDSLVHHSSCILATPPAAARDAGAAGEER